MTGPCSDHRRHIDWCCEFRATRATRSRNKSERGQRRRRPWRVGPPPSDFRPLISVRCPLSSALRAQAYLPPGTCTDGSAASRAEPVCWRPVLFKSSRVNVWVVGLVSEAVGCEDCRFAQPAIVNIASEATTASKKDVFTPPPTPRLPEMTNGSFDQRSEFSLSIARLPSVLRHPSSVLRLLVTRHLSLFFTRHSPLRLSAFTILNPGRCSITRRSGQPLRQLSTFSI
jgi:hypothetical protein